MYKLYVSIASYSFADMSYNELDIINTMCEYFNKNNGYRFIIVKSDGQSDELYKFIKNEKELREYIAEYNERTMKDTPVTKLKKEILELSQRNKRR